MEAPSWADCSATLLILLIRNWKTKGPLAQKQPETKSTQKYVIRSAHFSKNKQASTKFPMWPPTQLLYCPVYPWAWTKQSSSSSHSQHVQYFSQGSWAELVLVLYNLSLSMPANKHLEMSKTNLAFSISGAGASLAAVRRVWVWSSPLEGLDTSKARSATTPASCLKPFSVFDLTGHLCCTYQIVTARLLWPKQFWITILSWYR